MSPAFIGPETLLKTCLTDTCATKTSGSKSDCVPGIGLLEGVWIWKQLLSCCGGQLKGLSAGALFQMEIQSGRKRRVWRSQVQRDVPCVRVRVWVRLRGQIKANQCLWETSRQHFWLELGGGGEAVDARMHRCTRKNRHSLNSEHRRETQIQTPELSIADQWLILIFGLRAQQSRWSPQPRTHKKSNVLNPTCSGWFRAISGGKCQFGRRCRLCR